MKFRNLLSLALVGAAVSGCQSMRAAYDHPTADNARLLKDRYECMQSSMGYAQSGFYSNGMGSSAGAAIPNGALFSNCMALRGYSRNPEGGRLVVPAELVTRVY